MPLYYLHIDDEFQQITDNEGSDLVDLSSARQEALQAARQLWAAAILSQRDLGAQRFLIADDAGTVLDTVAMDEGLPLDLLNRLRTR